MVSTDETAEFPVQAKSEDGEGPPLKIMLFTVMLVTGLLASQIIPNVLGSSKYQVWSKGVELLTMICLSFIMVNVGYEFNLDKSQAKSCAIDYFVAMSAAGLPWIFVAVWLRMAFPESMSWGFALLMGRFAAPTSAGILFSMLEAAGLKDTWLFRKARVLAIFDDLDTILLMIPLKIFLIGFKWRLTFDAAIVTILLTMAWKKLHALDLPESWRWTSFYALMVTTFCEALRILSNGALHLEVLLPAFTLGCVTRVLAHDLKDQGQVQSEESVSNVVSTLFMLLVGLSMPPLFHGAGGSIGPLAMVGHILAITVLMTVGKMLLLVCYRSEADFRTRLALSLGMCPRGEVGAGVIAISLALGVRGPGVTVAVMSLALNLVLSSGFIMAVKYLAKFDAHTLERPMFPTSKAQTRLSAVEMRRRSKGPWSPDIPNTLGGGWGAPRARAGFFVRDTVARRERKWSGSHQTPPLTGWRIHKPLLPAGGLAWVVCGPPTAFHSGLSIACHNAVCAPFAAIAAVTWFVLRNRRTFRWTNSTRQKLIQHK